MRSFVILGQYNLPTLYYMRYKDSDLNPLFFNMHCFLWTVFVACGLHWVCSYLGETYYFTMNPRSAQRIVEGSRAFLECDVNDRSYIVFDWYMDGVILENTTRRHQIGSNLVIEQVDRYLDSGVFTCSATNASTSWRIISTSAYLNILCKSCHLSSIQFKFNNTLTCNRLPVIETSIYCLWRL